MAFNRLFDTELGVPNPAEFEAFRQSRALRRTGDGVPGTADREAGDSR